MDPTFTDRIKRGAVLVAAVAIAGYASYQVAAAQNAPRLTEIATVSCGTLAPANVSIPLKTLNSATPKLGFTVGPLDMPGAGGAVRLHFDPAIDGTVRDVGQHGDLVHLPVTAGRNKLLPEKVTLTCRDGAITTVRYTIDRQSSQTFNLVRHQPAEAALPADGTATAAVAP